MGLLIGALMLVAGVAAIIVAVMGTQNQVFATLTGHPAPTPQPVNFGGSSGAPSGPFGNPLLPFPFGLIGQGPAEPVGNLA